MRWAKIYIDNQPTIYSISEYGDLVNDNTGRIRKRTYTKRGYLRYVLSVDNQLINRFGHRLVAEYFVNDLPENKTKDINHKDGNKKNNYYENLEYVTNQENTDHAIQLGLFKPQEQETKKLVKQFNLKGEYINTYESISETGRKLNINISDISDICNRKNNAKQANGYQFRFENDEFDITNISNLTSGIKQKIVQLTLDGIYVNEFDSVADANRSLGKIPNNSGIVQCCRGKIKRIYGYLWKYKNELIDKSYANGESLSQI